MGILRHMFNYFRNGVIGSLLLCLFSCGGREDLAPVVDLNGHTGNHHAAPYVVKRGDTLYAIAFRYDWDYQELAKVNHLRNSYSLQVGQRIYFDSGNRLRSSISRSRHGMSRVTPSRFVQNKRIFRGSGRWLWPAHGHVVANFVPEQGKKGLDIAGKKGDKIYAAGKGTVAYAGSGLAGYGNLIIIRHDNQYLTAYGNNARNLVTEGQVIHAGQPIAEMGVVDRRYWGVHFEIRRSGKPVNPLNYLR